MALRLTENKSIWRIPYLVEKTHTNLLVSEIGENNFYPVSILCGRHYTEYVFIHLRVRKSPSGIKWDAPIWQVSFINI